MLYCEKCQLCWGVREKHTNNEIFYELRSRFSNIVYVTRLQIVYNIIWLWMNREKKLFIARTITLCAMHTDKRESKLVIYGYCMHIVQIEIPHNTLCCLAILTLCSAIIVYQTFWCFSSPLFKPFSLFLPFSPHTHSLRSCCCALHDVCNISSRTVAAICVIHTHIHTCVK